MVHSQCTIQNRNVHTCGLNGALWDMELVHCGICETGLWIGGNIRYDCIFLHFLNTEMAQVVEILTYEDKETSLCVYHCNVSAVKSDVNTGFQF